MALTESGGNSRLSWPPSGREHEARSVREVCEQHKKDAARLRVATLTTRHMAEVSVRMDEMTMHVQKEQETLTKLGDEVRRVNEINGRLCSEIAKQSKWMLVLDALERIEVRARRATRRPARPRRRRASEQPSHHPRTRPAQEGRVSSVDRRVLGQLARIGETARVEIERGRTCITCVTNEVRPAARLSCSQQIKRTR